MKSNRQKQIERVSKKIFLIRIALGYATHQQRMEGWEKEMKSVKEMLEHAKKLGETATGGFSYRLLKEGKIKITPNFSFLVKR